MAVADSGTRKMLKKILDLWGTRGRLSAVLLSVALVAACDSGTGQNTPAVVSPTEATVVAVGGSVTKGKVANATIKVYAVGADGQKTGNPIATTTTDENGDYSFQLTNFSGVYVVEATGGTYIDEATGVSMQIPDNAPLRAVSSVDASSGTAKVTATVTPLTEVAVRVAEQKSGGLTADNVKASNDEVGALFFGDTAGAGDKLLTTNPADITKDSSATQTDAEKTYGLLLGAISVLQSNSGSLSDTLAGLASDIAGDGNLASSSGALIAASTQLIDGATNNSGVTSSTKIASILTAAASGAGTAVAQSSEADITRFRFDDTLLSTIDANAHTVTVLEPAGTDLAALADPTIVVSLGASAAADGTADFSSDVVYVVTAEDGTTVNWTVSVSVAESSASPATDITGANSDLISTILINNTQHAIVGSVAALADLTSLDAVQSPADIFAISSGATIALVSGSYQTGDVKYLVTAEDGTHTSEWSVVLRVNDPQPQPDFSIDNGDLSLMVDAKGVQLKTSGGLETAALSFSSSDTGVVTVDSSGALTVVGAGTATVTATKARVVGAVVEYLPATATIQVTVTKLEQSALAFTSSAISVSLGQSVSNVLSGGSGTGAVSYASSDESVATVAADGSITVIAAGSTTITAQKAGDDMYQASNSASYSLTVTPATQETCVIDQSKWDECKIN